MELKEGEKEGKMDNRKKRTRKRRRWRRKRRRIWFLNEEDTGMCGKKGR